MTEVEKKLMSARALTATTGVMHDLQVQMLKNWGSLAFGSWYEWEAAVSVEKKTVTYKVTPAGKFKADKDELAMYVASLDRSIHWLLGDDWALDIEQNKKPLYKGGREVKQTNEQRKSRVKAPARHRPSK